MTRSYAAATVIICLFSYSPGLRAQTANTSIDTKVQKLCDFARSPLGSQGDRRTRVNLAFAENYDYGEVYGQVFFDFRRGDTSQSPQKWFEGFKGALLATGFFSEKKQ